MSNWRALGYLITLVPPVLLWASIAANLPALGLVVLLFVFPLLRAVFGDTDGRIPPWTERVATALHRLPLICALAHGTAVCLVIGLLRRGNVTGSGLAWFSGSLWMAFVFGSCVAHELVHRRDAISRNAGRILSGIIGYPILEHDHHTHHLKNGDVRAGECARTSETVWGFSWRRIQHVIPAALDQDAARRGSRLVGGLPLAACATVITAIAFAWAGGLAGLASYVVAAVATGWALQAMTYIQHWGLEIQDHAVAGAAGWEDRCQLQAWLTLGISFHQSHHDAATVPYYHVAPSATSPKAPAGYVILFFASLIPGVWRALMFPALERWKESQGPASTAGRRLICLR